MQDNAHAFNQWRLNEPRLIQEQFDAEADTIDRIAKNMTFLKKNFEKVFVNYAEKPQRKLRKISRQAAHLRL